MFFLGSGIAVLGIEYTRIATVLTEILLISIAVFAILDQTGTPATWT